MKTAISKKKKQRAYREAASALRKRLRQTKAATVVELGDIKLKEIASHGNTVLYLAQRGSRYAVVFWNNRKNQFTASAPGGGMDYSNGWREKAVDYVANWKSRSGIRKDLKTAKEEIEYLGY